MKPTPPQFRRLRPRARDVPVFLHNIKRVGPMRPLAPPREDIVRGFDFLEPASKPTPSSPPPSASSSSSASSSPNASKPATPSTPSKYSTTTSPPPTKPTTVIAAVPRPSDPAPLPQHTYDVAYGPIPRNPLPPDQRPWYWPFDRDMDALLRRQEMRGLLKLRTAIEERIESNGELGRLVDEARGFGGGAGGGRGKG